MNRGMIRHQESVKAELTDLDRQKLNLIIQQDAERVITDNTALSCFCMEKSRLAAESAEFYLRQRLQLLKAGMPGEDAPYWQLVNQNLSRLMQVFIALFQLHRGYVFFLSEEYPTVCLWVLTSRQLEEHDAGITQYAISLCDQFQYEQWLNICLHSKSVYFKENLMSVVSCHDQLSCTAFKTLEARHELDPKFVGDIIRRNDGNVIDLSHIYLAKGRNTTSIDWVLEQRAFKQDLFLQLMLRDDRTAWFRRNILPDMQSPEQKCFAHILTLPEAADDLTFDLLAQDADIIVALSGQTERTDEILDLLVAEHSDALTEQWINCLYLLFGERLPVNPAQLGIDIEHDEALVLLQNWWQECQGMTPPKKIRLGRELCFDSTIAALTSPVLSARLRLWLWRELCIVCRMYVNYSPFAAPGVQNKVIRGISQHSMARERFDLRIRNAVVGY